MAFANSDEFPLVARRWPSLADKPRLERVEFLARHLRIELANIKQGAVTARGE